MKRLCLLFAGGESRRFGSPKAFARYKGKSFLEISLENLLYVCDSIFVSVSEKTPSLLIDHIKSLDIDVNLIFDINSLPCKGPPRGLVSFVTSIGDNAAEEIILLGIDYPFLKKETFKKFVDISSKLNTNSSTVLSQEGYPSVTIGYLRMNFARKFVNICKVKKRLTRLTDIYRCSSISILIGWSNLSENPLEFVSVNTPEQLSLGLSPQIKRINSILRIENNIECLKFIEKLSENNIKQAVKYLRLEIGKYERLGIKLFRDHAERDLNALLKLVGD